MTKHEELNMMEKTPDYRQLFRHIPNTVEVISSLAKDLEIFGEEVGWDFTVLMQVNLVLEELVINVINYGYPDNRVGYIDVLIETNAKEIHIHITDDGKPFNPFQREAPDLSLDIEDRPIGGLGIYLVKSYMHSYDYCYAKNKNKVTLIKRLIEE